MEISHFFDIDAGRLSIVVARLTIYQQIIHSLIVKKKEKKKKKNVNDQNYNQRIDEDRNLKLRAAHHLYVNTILSYSIFIVTVMKTYLLVD